MSTVRQFVIPAVAAIVLLLPFSALAHEHRVFTIGDKEYNITVGSLGEPVHVDDKAGVEVIVSQLGGDTVQQPMADGIEEGDDGPTGTPVEGLEKDLKVEVSAGAQKKIFPLEPEDGKSGSYEAVFYPTVQTTYSYRVFGTLNGTSIDITYTCSPDSTANVAEEKSSVHVSDKVTQTLKGGAFGCPEAKADVQFPEQTMNLTDLTTKVDAMSQDRKSIDFGLIGFVMGVLSFGIAVRALKKAKGK